MPAQDAQNDGTLLFDFMPARTVVLRPAAGQLTSDAGLLAIRQFDERVGWTRRFCACLADERLDPVHTIESMIHQRVYGILAGYEDCNDHDALRGEPIFKMIAGRLPEDDPLASQPTLSRLENSVQPAELLQLVDLMIELGIERVKRKHRGRIPDRVTIDLDPTDDPTHGQQQLTFFHGYYDQHQYFPMIISEPTTRHVFVAWLRHGKALLEATCGERPTWMLRAQHDGVIIVARRPSGSRDRCDPAGVSSDAMRRRQGVRAPAVGW